MDEKTTLVVTAVPNPGEMESVQGYLRGVLPLLKGAGGKLRFEKRPQSREFRTETPDVGR